ncbi:MAG: LamG domain-containing protein [Labilithrix sp.]|nr:LamG domain-containing protein [Labilithrix sp.]MCW5817123.1 LamG domain-containing protein [Labilithrix sp.]
MSRRGWIAALLALALACGACSLATSLDGLSGGDANANAAPGDDAGATATPPATDGGEPPPDAGDDPLDPYGREVSADAPSSWWRFEEEAGASTVADARGGHAGTPSQEMVLGVPGAIGKGARFAPWGGLDVGDVYDFAGASSFTLEVWAADEPNGKDRWIFSKRDEDVDPFQGWIMYARGSDSHVHFEFWGQGVDLSTQTRDRLASGFVHLVLTVAAEPSGRAVSTMYVDGVPQGGGTIDPKIDAPNTGEHLTIGASFTGVLDEVAIYERALPRERIVAHFEAGRASAGR